MNAAADDLEQYRQYLTLLARMNIGRKLQGKVDASDIVQQTMLEAHQRRELFRGETARERTAWMREILGTCLAKAFRSFGQAKRDVARETSMQADLDASSARLEAFLAADQSSPSRRLQSAEQVLRVAAALMQLPDAQREAMILRHGQGWSLNQVAEHLGCSAPAVVGFLKRGTRQLRVMMTEESTDERE